MNRDHQLLPRSRVIVIESQRIIGEALRRLIQADGELDVVAAVPTVHDDEIALHQPDLLILDADDLEGELEEATARCRAAAPAARIVVLAAHPGQPSIQRCLTCGIAGYIIKDISTRAMMQACTAVARGADYYDPRVVAASGKRRRVGRLAHELSLRETEVVRLIAAGLSNTEIGGRLGVSEKTVKNHVSSILSKLQTTSRSKAAIYAIRMGIAEWRESRDGPTA
jgi:two-component system response regulator DegU